MGVGMLLIGHLWADFFLQSAKLAELKNRSFVIYFFIVEYIPLYFV